MPISRRRSTPPPRRRGAARSAPVVLLALLPVALVALVVALPRPVVAAQAAAPPPAAASALHVDEVTVAVRDADGQSAAAGADDLTVSLDGQPRQVLEVRPEGRPWRLVVYFDAALAAPRTLARASRALETLSRDLTELGTVEVVLGEDRPRRLLPASRDPVTLAAVLARAALMESGEDRLLELRREALEELSLAAEPADVEAAVTAAAQREAELVAARQDALLAFLAGDGAEAGLDEPAAQEATGDALPGGGARPAALLYVGDGFDLDPAAFWRQRTGASPQVELPDLAASQADLARAAAALGWTVVPVTLRGDADEVPSRFGTAIEKDPVRDETRVLGSFRVPRRRSAAERAEAAVEAERQERLGAPPLPAAPRAPLAELADETGGRVVVAVAQLPEVLEDLSRRSRVRFATLDVEPGASSGGDGAGGDLGAPRPLAVTAVGKNLRVTARRWSADGTPAAVSALRARRLLAGELDPGEITVRAALAFTAPAARQAGDAAAGDAPARIEVQVEPPPGSLGSAVPPRRITLAAVAPERREVRVLQLGVEGTWARSRGGDDFDAPRGTWIYSDVVDLPVDAERVAVVVEQEPGAAARGALGGGVWGGTVAGLFDADRPAGDTGYDLAAGLLPAPRPVNLLRPDGRMLVGRVTFETVVGPQVRRVEWYVDDRLRAEVDRPPFAAVLDLGRLPLTRVVEAVGYGPDGAEVGRDELVVNGGGSRLAVRIAEPTGPRAVGTVDVAVDVQVPEGGVLDRLELYWRDRLAATLFQPPFRQRLRIPPDDAEGFLRAVARLSDGSSAEDVRYLNGPLAAERVDVRLTELYVVVSDRDGRPVRGLSAADFTVREDGRRQAVETFSDAGDLPLTVGLAVDSSASMFVKLAAVQQAAADFLGELKPGRDRAFLVDFDDEARLAAGPTKDLDDVSRSVFRLVSDGRTSLWKAIVYSLVQLQAAPGRRALVVYSDGADEDADFSYRTALDFARKVAVPVYVIVSNDEAVRTGGLGFPSLGRRLERLTSEVGGRVWLVRGGDDLSAIYRQIEQELAAQYLLGYYPQRDGDGRSGYRRVEVDVKGRGLTARTLAGYER